VTDTPKCRLVTRSDFDGLVCAVLLKERGIIDRIDFVHPKDMQDGKIPMGPSDISTNLPYVHGCHLAFDHHASELQRLSGERPANHVIDPNAASAARVVYDYYGGAKAFPRVSVEMMEAVDKADSAQFSLDEILNPKGWVLLNFLMDARTGLGRFRNFRVSNYKLMMELIDYCRDHTIDQIRTLCRPPRPGARATAAGLGAARKGGGPGSAQGRTDLFHQPFHSVCALPAGDRIAPRHLGNEAPEHRIRDRQVHHRPFQPAGCWCAVPALWRWRTHRRGYLPDPQ
jgi:hypothetical protein